MEEIAIRLTTHSLERMKERSGLNKKAAQKIAEKAYYNGLCEQDVRGTLLRYMENEREHSQDCAEVRIYGDKLFVFANLSKVNTVRYNSDGNKVISLITVLQIPAELMDLIKVYKKKKDKLSISKETSNG